MDFWYKEYWSQCWYKNSFLVRRPSQIGRTRTGAKEWNNIFDSGCNFTCLSMMIGVDPARLSSELSDMSFFYADSHLHLQAEFLNGKTGGLIWDQNKPNKNFKKLELLDFWHPQLKKRTNITVEFIGIHETKIYEEGVKIVNKAVDLKQHVICGPEEHSVLVAGKNKNGFIIWDPDITEQQTVEDNVNGNLTLKGLFDTYNNNIEFWKYQITFA